MRKKDRFNKLKQEKLTRQKYRCGICLKPSDISSKVRLDLDHCHISGFPREVLCSRCNQGLGHFYENIESLKNAIAYLEKYEYLKINRLTGEVEDYPSKPYKKKIVY